MHEHIYLGNWNNRIADSEWFNREEALDMICGVLMDAKRHGVKTIVDATPLNIGRDVDLMQAAAERSGLNIIASTGVYVDEDLWVNHISELNMLKMIMREIECGIQGTISRCGVIKCGTGEFGFTKNNKKILRACAQAQKESGLPIITHCRPENTRQGLFQLDIFEEQGADLSKVVIGHFREGDPLDYAENVMKRGSYLAIDQMNFNAHHLEFNIKTIVKLCQKGYASQLILSHDAVICYNSTRWADWNHRQYINYAPDSLSYIIRVVIPMLKEKKVTDEQIHTIFVENPKRLFT